MYYFAELIISMKKLPYFALLAALILTSCVAPRVVTNSGKVTPKANFVAGYHTSYNISTQAGVYVKDLIVDNVVSLSKKDSIKFDDNFAKINKAAIAYQLDPISNGNEFYIRYGVMKRVDIGAKLAGNAKVVDAQFQFLGPLGNINDETSKRVYGSFGIQYSTQSQSLPSVLSNIQNRLGYDFNRKDFMFPLLFSYSLGNEEKYGSLSGGLVVNYSIINYATTPIDIYNLNQTKLEPSKYKEKYLSYGMFINAKLGYKYVFVIPSLSVFYQNYGTYQLLNGTSASFKGLTVIPGIGIRFRLGRNTFEKKSKQK